MINIPQVGGQAVPVSSPNTQEGMPLRLPPFVDPAQIILQAAQLHQQKQIANQQMLQGAIGQMSQAVQAAATLSEHKREAEVNEHMAQLTHDIAMQKLEPEMAVLAAHAAYLKSQTDMMNDPEVAKRLFSLTQPGPNGEPPKMSFEQYASMAPRGIQKNVYAKAAADYQSPSGNGANMMTGTTMLAGQKAGEQAMGAQQPVVGKIDSLFTQINRFNTLAGMVPKSAMDRINQMGLDMAATNGPADIKPYAANLKQQAKILADEAQSTFGSGSDAKLNLGNELFNPNPNASTIMSQNQIAKYSLLSRRNSLDKKPDNYLPPKFNAMPPTQNLSDFLSQGQAQGWDKASAMQAARQMVNSGLLNDDVTGQ